MTEQIRRNLMDAELCLADMAVFVRLPPGGQGIARDFEKAANIKRELCGLWSIALLPLVAVAERAVRRGRPCSCPNWPSRTADPDIPVLPPRSSRRGLPGTQRLLRRRTPVRRLFGCAPRQRP